MDKTLGVLLMAVVGGLVAMQAPLNAGLGRATGEIPAALVNFAVGTVLLVTIVVLSGKAGGLSEAAGVDWYYLLGGLLGAAYVYSGLALVGTIGAGGVAAATIAGQLSASVLIDRLGVLGLEETQITPERLAGVALLFAGTYLVVR